MKSEIFQICNLVTSVKHALKTSSFIQYEGDASELSVKFEFIGENGEKGEVIEGVDSWYARVMYNDLLDIKYLIPPQPVNRMALGFLNQTRQLMILFFPNDVVRVWVPTWEFDEKKNGFNIVYKENDWPDHPKGKPQYADNSNEFMLTLDNLIKFSVAIGLPGWGEYYARAMAMLKGDFNYELDDRKRKEFFESKGHNAPKIRHLDIPKKNLDMFEAAGAADAFGAVGSWNDGPCKVAIEKERKADYDALSDALYAQLTIAIMYAINEW